MPRTVALIALTAIAALAAPLGARNLPDFSGAWVLVPERSTPAGSAALGPEFKAVQDATKLSLDLASMHVVRGAPFFPSVPQTPEPTRTVYTLDGSDTVWRASAAESPFVPPGKTTMTTLESIHRAAWTANQLVIVTHNTYRLTVNWGQPVTVTLRQTVWWALALQGDGTLGVNSLIASDPLPGGPQQNLPVAVSSIYRKSS
jgi:hypothetical protein